MVKRSSINLVVVCWLTDDDNLVIGGEAVLAVDLLLATTLSGRASPDIDVLVSTVVEVIGALLAEVLICFLLIPLL